MASEKIPYDKAGAAKLRKAKPSELILIALDDLAKVERQKKTFAVYMGRWFVPSSVSPDGKCVVCLAGSVMAGTLAIPPDVDAGTYDGEIEPRDVDGASIRYRLVALNDARAGYVPVYLRSLGHQVPEALKTAEVEFPSYAGDRRGFKSGLRKMARILAEHGL